MNRVFSIAVLVLCFASPTLAGVDGTGRNLDPLNAGGIVPDTIRLVQSSLAVIKAPTRIDTDHATVDFNGGAVAPGDITLTVNGVPVGVAPDGSFGVRHLVPLGRSRLHLVLQGGYGDSAEHDVFVHRTTATTGTLGDGVIHAQVVDNEKVTADRNLLEAMRAIYKKAGIYKREGGLAGGDSQAVIESFGEITVLHVDGNLLTLEVSFRWTLDDSQKTGSANGIFIIETDGTSYKAVELKTGGKTY